MTASPLELAGMLAASGGAAAGLLAGRPSLRYGGMAVALVAAPALVAGDVWNQDRIVELRDSPALIAAAALVFAGLVAATAKAFHRLPGAFAAAAFLTLSLRLPIEIGGETSHLLVPLYLVIAAGVVESAYSSFAGNKFAASSAREPEGRPVIRAEGSDAGAAGSGAHGAAGPAARTATSSLAPASDRPAVRWLLRLLAASIVLYAVQSAYSDDVSNAIENGSFFLVPFAVMLALLLESRWDLRLKRLLLAAIAGLAVVFAAVAVWQYAVRDLFLNDDLLDSNQLHLYFRANSVFFDPNILGRYLALAIVALAAAVAYARDTRSAAAAALAIGALLAGLVVSFSVTSVAALLAGLVAVAWLRWGTRVGGATGVAVAVALGAIALGAREDGGLGSSGDVAGATSGRSVLIEGGVELFGDKPAAGWGSGAFGAAFVREIRPAKSPVSHAEPVTVASEQGIVGLLVYAPLVFVSLFALLGARARDSAGRAIAAACYVTLLVHTMGYAGFAIDPVTWALVGLALSLERHGRPERANPAAAPLRVRCRRARARSWRQARPSDPGLRPSH